MDDTASVFTAIVEPVSVEYDTLVAFSVVAFSVDAFSVDTLFTATVKAKVVREVAVNDEVSSVEVVIPFVATRLFAVNIPLSIVE